MSESMNTVQCHLCRCWIAWPYDSDEMPICNSCADSPDVQLAALRATVAQQAERIAKLEQALSNALINERKDGCCLPFVNPCHCWRCTARRLLTAPSAAADVV
jgi:hypothetical protein